MTRYALNDDWKFIPNWDDALLGADAADAEGLEPVRLPHTVADGLTPWGRYRLSSATLTAGDGQSTVLKAMIVESADSGQIRHAVETSGNGPIDAFVRALGQLGVDVHVLDYVEHALSSGGDATAAAYVECDVDGQVLWGCGIDPSTMRAGFNAIVSAINRALR